MLWTIVYNEKEAWWNQQFSIYNVGLEMWECMLELL
jgi:hypothetical protein